MEGIVELTEFFFLDCGFIDGDCLTARPVLFVTVLGFLLDFRKAIEFWVPIGALKSIFMSTGDAVSEVSELRKTP